MEWKKTNRRTFLTDTGKTALGVGLGLTALASACNNANTVKAAAGSMGFTQQPLPYGYDALEKAIDALTMELHYSKHAAGYASNLASAAKEENVDTSKPLEQVLAQISKYSTKMRNNGGGHYNHELFWQSMSPNGGGEPSGKLLDAINSSFNSFDAFKNEMAEAGKGRFGSGWAWLYLDADKKLRIGSTPNQDNPLMDISEIKGQPILGLDVWEHAYYLRYQNKRADYINAWWQVVDWGKVGERMGG